jgi:hypothetical protein
LKQDLKMPPVDDEVDLTGSAASSGLPDSEHRRKLLDTLTNVTSLVSEGYVQDVEMVIGLIRNKMA